jgi:hypothetical protein
MLVHVAKTFILNQVKKRLRSLRNVLPTRSLVFMCMRRGPNLKLLPPVLRAADVVMMAIPFSRGGPRPLVLGPKGRAPLLRFGDRYDGNIDLSIYEQMVVPVHRPERTRCDPPMVNFMKAGTDMRSLRFWPEDPRRLQRSFFSDDRFWLAHQADWYESTILPKGRVTTEMKWVDWPYLLDLPAPIEEVM